MQLMETTERTMTARYTSKCMDCGLMIDPGDEITKGYKGRYRHARCRFHSLVKQARSHLATHSTDETERWLLAGLRHAELGSDDEVFLDAVMDDYLDAIAWVRTQ